MKINKFFDFLKKKKVSEKEIFIDKLRSELDEYELTLKLGFRFKGNFERVSTEDKLLELMELGKIGFIYSHVVGTYLSFDRGLVLHGLINRFIMGESEYNKMMKTSYRQKNTMMSDYDHLNGDTSGMDIRMEKFLILLEDVGVKSNDIIIRNQEDGSDAYNAGRQNTYIYFKALIDEDILLEIVDKIWVDNLGLPTVLPNKLG